MSPEEWVWESLSEGEILDSSDSASPEGDNIAYHATRGSDGYSHARRLYNENTTNLYDRLSPFRMDSEDELIAYSIIRPRKLDAYSGGFVDKGIMATASSGSSMECSSKKQLPSENEVTERQENVSVSRPEVEVVEVDDEACSSVSSTSATTSESSLQLPVTTKNEAVTAEQKPLSRASSGLSTPRPKSVVVVRKNVKLRFQDTFDEKVVAKAKGKSGQSEHAQERSEMYSQAGSLSVKAFLMEHKVKHGALVPVIEKRICRMDNDKIISHVKLTHKSSNRNSVSSRSSRSSSSSDSSDSSSSSSSPSSDSTSAGSGSVKISYLMSPKDIRKANSAGTEKTAVCLRDEIMANIKSPPAAEVVNRSVACQEMLGDDVMKQECSGDVEDPKSGDLEKAGIKDECDETENPHLGENAVVTTNQPMSQYSRSTSETSDSDASSCSCSSCSRNSSSSHSSSETMNTDVELDEAVPSTGQQILEDDLIDDVFAAPVQETQEPAAMEEESVRADPDPEHDAEATQTAHDGNCSLPDGKNRNHEPQQASPLHVKEKVQDHETEPHAPKVKTAQAKSNSALITARPTARKEEKASNNVKTDAKKSPKSHKLSKKKEKGSSNSVSKPSTTTRRRRSIVKKKVDSKSRKRHRAGSYSRSHRHGSRKRRATPKRYHRNRNRSRDRRSSSRRHRHSRGYNPDTGKRRRKVPRRVRSRSASRPLRHSIRGSTSRNRAASGGRSGPMLHQYCPPPFYTAEFAAANVSHVWYTQPQLTASKERGAFVAVPPPPPAMPVFSRVV